MLRLVRFSGWLGGMTSMAVAVALAAGRGCTGAGELEARAGVEPTYENLQSRRVALPSSPGRTK